MKPTQPLREEHQELLPHIEDIRVVAGSVQTLEKTELDARLHAIEEFLQQHLIPHAKAEDEVLYPLIDRVSGTDEVTKTMRYDHQEVVRLTNELRHTQRSDTQGIQKLLYILYGLVKTHFNKEEQIYLPFLDSHLNASDANKLFAEMEDTAKQIKASL